MGGSAQYRNAKRYNAKTFTYDKNSADYFDDCDVITGVLRNRVGMKLGFRSDELDRNGIKLLNRLIKDEYIQRIPGQTTKDINYEILKKIPRNEVRKYSSTYADMMGIP